MGLDQDNFNEMLVAGGANYSDRAIGGQGTRAGNAGAALGDQRYAQYVNAPHVPGQRGNFSERYKEVPQDKKDKAQGAGNLSINSFARMDSAVAADSFEGLAEDMKKAISEAEIKGDDGKPVQDFLKREDGDYKGWEIVKKTAKGSLKSTIGIFTLVAMAVK